MFESSVNTKKQGDVGLGYAISYFSRLGWAVSIPLTDSQDYDLVVDDPDRGLRRVSIKTTSQRKSTGGYEVGLRVLGGNSKKNYVHKTADLVQYDDLFVLTEEGTMYFLPKPNVKSSIVVGKKYEKYNIGNCK